MTILSIGDLSQSFMLRRQTGHLKTDLQTLAQEMTTGLVADATRATKGDFAQLNAMAGSIARLASFATATNEASLYASAMQSALGAVSDLANGLNNSLFLTPSLSQPATIDMIGSDAEGKFRTAISMLNTRLGDRALFAGVATDRNPLAGADTILSALDTAIAGAISTGDVKAVLDDWFANPAGFLAIAYQGGAPLSPLPIGNGETADLGITAADEGLRDTLKGLAMATMLNRGALSGQPEARAALAEQAGATLLSAQPKLINTAATLGLAENRISTTAIRNASERSALELARNAIISADPYETATRLQDAQNQLETLFAVTARLSRLSLTDYL